MEDRCGRTIDYLRLSVTDRCDLRCRYCMPEAAEGAGDVLALEELTEIAAAVDCGVRKVRLTGGEPLLRRDLLELCRRLRAVSPLPLEDGAFAENINIRGMELKTLPVGTRLRVGEAELEITQVGKECHTECAVKRRVGRCVMPTEGVFAVVVKEGAVRPGDEVEVER